MNEASFSLFGWVRAIVAAFIGGRKTAVGSAPQTVWVTPAFAGAL